MKILNFLAGERQGKGWIQMHPNRSYTLFLFECAQPKLHDVVLFIERQVKVKIEGKDTVAAQGLGIFGLIIMP